MIRLQLSDLSNIFPGTDAYKNQQNLKNEIGILKSFNLNYRVMQELPEFHVDICCGREKRNC